MEYHLNYYLFRTFALHCHSRIESATLRYRESRLSGFRIPPKAGRQVRNDIDGNFAKVLYYCYNKFTRRDINSENLNYTSDSHKFEPAFSFSLIISNIKFILVFVVIFILLLYFYISNVKSLFESKATMLVIQNSPTQTLDTSVLSVSQQLAETFAKVAITRPILDETASNLSLPTIDPSNIKTRFIPRTQLIEIIVDDHSPELAAAIANELVNVFKKRIAELQNAINLSSRAQVEITESAIPNPNPIYPKKVQFMLIGILASFLIAIGLVYVAEAIDGSVESEYHINRLFPDIPVIASIPLDKGKVKDDTTMEAIRELRTNLSFLRPDNPPKSIAIISATSGEGKTFMALELAKTLALADKKVLLVDADLRKGKLTSEVGLSKKAGLSEALKNGQKLSDLELHKLESDNLFFLNAGKSPLNPGELLSSKRAKIFFESLEKNKDFEIIIFDTPPVLAVADVISLVPHLGGAVIILQSNKTTKAQIRKVIDSVSGVKADLLGFILNKAKYTEHSYYGYGQYGKDK